MKKLLVLVLLVPALFPSVSQAKCKCVCIEGEVQVVCQRTYDIKPVCSPRVCPITPSSIEPIQRPRVPPIGTKRCVQKQIYNDDTGRYEWKEVCY